MLYKCPECPFTTNWTEQDFADQGEPVCPNDDNDMKPASKTPERENVEVVFDQIILDDLLYENIGARTHSDEKDFKVKDPIIYFMGNNTWRGEVVKKTKTGYLVFDY